MARPKKKQDDKTESQATLDQATNEAKTFVRDEKGLVQGVDYKYNEDGSVDWRAMIPKNFLYLNNSITRREEIEKKYGKPYEEIDVELDNVEDRDLIISLGGIKHLASLRGYEEVQQHPFSSSIDYAAVNCRIRWVPNYETEGREISFEENACAHLDNTTNFYSKYLIEAATNRAFCRCVRSFLRINIVSREELGADNQNSFPSEENESGGKSKQIATLQKELDRHQLNWDQIKAKIKKAQQQNGSYKNLDVDECSGIEDFPSDIIFDLIVKLKKQ